MTHTQEYTVLPGVVRHTFIIFGLFTTPNLCPPTQNPGDATVRIYLCQQPHFCRSIRPHFTISLQRETKWLRQQYYDHEIKQLETTESRKLWHAVKRFSGTSQSNKCLTNLLDYNKDNVLADDIFAGFASDLEPLSDGDFIRKSQIFPTPPPCMDALLNHLRDSLTDDSRKNC